MVICKKSVVMEGTDVFTPGRRYEVEQEYEGELHVIDNAGQFHGIGNPGEAWFEDHFEKIDVVFAACPKCDRRLAFFPDNDPGTIWAAEKDDETGEPVFVSPCSCGEEAFSAEDIFSAK